MKDLILFYGRTGSTVLYDSICNNKNWVRPPEISSELHHDNFEKNIEYFQEPSWVFKYHINTGHQEKFNPLLAYFLEKERPNNIYFSYRQDIYDTVLSYVISSYYNVWNSTKKETYEPFYSKNFDNCINDYVQMFELLNSLQQTLFPKYKIIPMEYNNVIKFETKIVKQNTKYEKINCILNIDEFNNTFDKKLSGYSFTSDGTIIKK